MRRARLVEASVCTEREGGGGGGTRGETGARKEGGKGACQLCRRRVTNRPTACYHPASPGILSLSFYLYFSFSLSLLYPVYRITAVSQCSSRVTTAQCLPRVVVRSTALSLHLVTLFQQQSLSLVQNCVVHQIGSIVFFL